MLDEHIKSYTNPMRFPEIRLTKTLQLITQTKTPSRRRVPLLLYSQLVSSAQASFFMPEVPEAT